MTAPSRALLGWFVLAAGTSLVLPAGVLLRWGRDPVINRALSPYVTALLIQIATEGVLSRRSPPWTILISGALFTAFRLRQLQRAHHELRNAGLTPGRRAACATVRIGLVFWSANLGVLASHALRRRR